MTEQEGYKQLVDFQCMIWNAVDNYSDLVLGYPELVESFPDLTRFLGNVGDEVLTRLEQLEGLED